MKVDEYALSNMIKVLYHHVQLKMLDEASEDVCTPHNEMSR